MNWGWKIAIFLTLFIGFILSMVVYSFNFTSDLVSEDYYNQEIQYQANIDAQENALPFADSIFFEQTEEKIVLNFPSSFNKTIEKGDISFYRHENSKLDVSFPLNLDNNKQNFDRKKLIQGSYKVTIQFIENGVLYLVNKDIWI